MKTKQKKQSLFDVRRRNQREQKRKKNSSKLRKLLLRLAFSRPTSPIHMAMKMATAEAIGLALARRHARILPSVASRIILKYINKA